MQTYIAIVIMFFLVLIAPSCAPAAKSAQPSCDKELENVDISELKENLNQLAELQRQNFDTIQFDPENIIRTSHDSVRLFIVPYEMLGVDGGNAVERYVAVFELPFAGQPSSNLQTAAHLKQKHFALTGFYPVGIWGAINWHRATISNNQIVVPAVSLLCAQYKCCNGGPGFISIDTQISNGQVIANITNQYNGSNDSSKCQ
jgi:hypothetical protein